MKALPFLLISALLCAAPAVVMFAADASPYTAVDARALAAPASTESSLERLAAYLAQGLGSDVEKARAAYRWITDSIAYDTDSFFSGAYPAQDAGSVLSSSKSVCAGYSALFSDICRRMGLSVEVIHGYAKGWGYSAGATFSETNHDWNAILVNGGWRLVDCTWGAGYVGNDRRFVKAFTDVFFLSPPDQFILSHFPADPQWQLLPTPWTIKDFSEAVFVYPPAYALGVRARSHTKGVFSSAGRERILFDAPAGVVGMSAVDGQHDLALTQATDGGFEVLCSFLKPGRSMLRVFATTVNGPATYSAVIEYTIDVQAGLGDAARFPLTYSNFGPRRIRVQQPLSQQLAAGTPSDFSLTVPEATSVIVVSGGTRCTLTRQGDLFTGSVPVAAGTINVFAQFPGNAQYEGILTYRGR